MEQLTTFEECSAPFLIGVLQKPYFLEQGSSKKIVPRINSGMFRISKKLASIKQSKPTSQSERRDRQVSVGSPFKFSGLDLNNIIFMSVISL